MPSHHLAHALSGRGSPATLDEEEITACNGLRVLCDRRLDEVVLPGMHKLDVGGRPARLVLRKPDPADPRQLGDGIRFLMLDPHYGLVDSKGRVRTDLRAEGTSRIARRNRAASDRRTLLRRIRNCRSVLGRPPNLIAVDFYEGGGVIRIARELNHDGAAVGEDG